MHIKRKCMNQNGLLPHLPSIETVPLIIYEFLYVTKNCVWYLSLIHTLVFVLWITIVRLLLGILEKDDGQKQVSAEHV